MNPLLIAALVSGIVSAGGAWLVQGWRYDSKEKDRIEAEQALAKLDRAKANIASEGFEHDKATNTIQFRTITKVVTEIIDRPVYLQQCIDADGLQQLGEAIRATGDASEPKGTVPTP